MTKELNVCSDRAWPYAKLGVREFLSFSSNEMECSYIVSAIQQFENKTNKMLERMKYVAGVSRWIPAKARSRRRSKATHARTIPDLHLSKSVENDQFVCLFCFHLLIVIESIGSSHAHTLRHIYSYFAYTLILTHTYDGFQWPDRGWCETMITNMPIR